MTFPSAASFPSEHRLHFLDGIRGWGSVIVFMHHLNLSGMSLFSAAPVFLFITDGHFAVYVFYVLSGFALTVKFVEKLGSYSVAHAATARYFRLAIPILATSFIAYVLLSAHLMFNYEAGRLVNSGWLEWPFRFEPSFGSLLSFSLYDGFFAYGEGANYNSSLWTIPYEFQGSMLAFFIAAIFLPREKGKKVHLLPILAIGLYYLHAAPPLACFIAGFLLVELCHSKAGAWRIVKVSATFMFIAVIYIVIYYRPTEGSWRFIVLAAALVFAGGFSPLWRAFFSCGLSRFLGKISFPLYLIHVTILCSFSSWLYLILTRWGYDQHVSAGITMSATIPLTIAAAYVLIPLERFSIRFSRRIAEWICHAEPTCQPDGMTEVRLSAAGADVGR